MLRLIAALLLFVEPLRFAVEALTVFPTLAYRGAPAAVELVGHGGVAALCAAAGLGLWNGAPDGRRLAMVAVVVSLLRTAQSLYWSALPRDTPPGDEPWILAGTLLVAVAAMLVLRPRRAGAA